MVGCLNLNSALPFLYVLPENVTTYNTSLRHLPLEESSVYTHLMAEDGGRGDNNGDVPISSIAAAQKGVFEMGTVITQPGLKRADSTELLHLTLHQVNTLPWLSLTTIIPINFVISI